MKFYRTFFYEIVCGVVVACTVGDWVQVECDYSPGICSEGGTGVVIAKVEGEHLPIHFHFHLLTFESFANHRTRDGQVYLWTCHGRFKQGRHHWFVDFRSPGSRSHN